MFRVVSRACKVCIYCRICNEALPGQYPQVDPAVIVDDCRQHEISYHSTTVFWQEYLKGAEVSFPDAVWLAAKMSGQLDSGADLLAAPVLTRRVPYEWLDGTGRAVVVRDLAALAEWLGPERAAREFAPA
jgi:hypothetical protein